MFGDFFKRRKMRVVAFGEPTVKWSDTNPTLFSIVFYENDNGRREYTIEGQNHINSFHRTQHAVHCETWKRTGLLPTWAKDPVAEKLSR